MPDEHVTERELREELLQTLNGAASSEGERKFLWFVDDNEQDYNLAWKDIDKGADVTFAAKPGATTKQTSTLGRFMRRKWDKSHERLSDNEIDKFVGRALANKGTLDHRITIVHGHEIVDAYEECFGGSSCMTDDCCDYVHLYAENNCVSLLKYDYSDIQARALIWDADDGSRCCDRIYPNDGQHISSIHRWCAINGIARRVGNGLPSPYASFYDGIDRTVTVAMPDNNFMPYMDTFRFMENNPKGVNGTVTLHNRPPGDMRFSLADDQDGGWNDRHSLLCHRCGEIHSGTGVDSYQLDMDYGDLSEYCSTCFRNDFVSVETNLYTSIKNVTQIVDTGRWVYLEDLANDNIMVCHRCNRLFSKDVNRNTYAHEEHKDKHICWECAYYAHDEGMINYSPEGRSRLERFRGLA